MTPQTAIDAARIAADLLLALVPAPVAHQILNDAEVRRSLAIGDGAAGAKYGPPPPSTGDEP